MNLAVSTSLSDPVAPSASDDANAEAAHEQAGYTALWREALATQARIQADLAQLQTTLRSALDMHCHPINRLPVTEAINNLKVEFVYAMDAKARQEMVPQPMRLLTDDALKNHADAESADTFDPDAYWAQLQSLYRDGKGADLACQQMASTLVRELALAKLKPAPAKPVLSLKLHAITDRDSLGQLTLNYDTCTRTWATLDALATFCSWAQDHATADRLADIRRTSFDRKFAPQQTVDLGTIQMVFFMKSIVWTLNPPLSARFREFISKFAGIDLPR